MSLAERFTGLLRRGVEQFDGKDEREFLPAALEILETPPSPASRFMAMAIGIFFLVAVVWAFVGKVDVLATATGRLVPAGKVKVIQPLDPGLVRAIAVQDGDHVRAGQVLIELDPTQVGADRDRLARDLATTSLEVARLTALKPLVERGGAPGPLIPPRRRHRRRHRPGARRPRAPRSTSRPPSSPPSISRSPRSAPRRARWSPPSPRPTPACRCSSQKARLHQQLHDEGFGTSFAYLDAQQQLSDARNDLKVDAERGGPGARRRRRPAAPARPGRSASSPPKCSPIWPRRWKSRTSSTRS